MRGVTAATEVEWWCSWWYWLPYNHIEETIVMLFLMHYNHIAESLVTLFVPALQFALGDTRSVLNLVLHYLRRICLWSLGSMFCKPHSAPLQQLCGKCSLFDGQFSEVCCLGDGSGANARLLFRGYFTVRHLELTKFRHRTSREKKQHSKYWVSDRWQNSG